MIIKELSVIINTYNEAKNIEACIKSIQDIADEIIVVDMQSKDATISIAERLGAKTYYVEKYGYVEPARNFAIKKASKKWILILDADERIPLSLKKIIRQIVENNSCDVLEIPFKNIFFKKWIEHSGWWPDYHPRLFKKGFVTWPETVEPHIQPKISGRIQRLPEKKTCAIIHYNKGVIKELLEMIEMYTFKASFFENKSVLSASDIVNYFSGEFNFRYFHKKGYLDGMRGFILSKFMEYYKFVEFARFWERKGYPELVDKNKLKDILKFYDLQIAHSQSENAELKKIKSSKFFKFWNIYCRYKDLIKKYMKNQYP